MPPYCTGSDLPLLSVAFCVDVSRGGDTAEPMPPVVDRRIVPDPSPLSSLMKPVSDADVIGDTPVVLVVLAVRSVEPLTAVTPSSCKSSALVVLLLFWLLPFSEIRFFSSGFSTRVATPSSKLSSDFVRRLLPSSTSLDLTVDDADGVAFSGRDDAQPIGGGRSGVEPCVCIDELCEVVWVNGAIENKQRSTSYD
jgi:hypothetical protein